MENSLNIMVGNKMDLFVVAAYDNIGRCNDCGAGIYGDYYRISGVFTDEQEAKDVVDKLFKEDKYHEESYIIIECKTGVIYRGTLL